MPAFSEKCQITLKGVKKDEGVHGEKQRTFPQCSVPNMGRQFFSGGLTASPAIQQPDTTRRDTTLAGESQRQDDVELFFGKIFALPTALSL